jgi:RHS repeat-associated protein
LTRTTLPNGQAVNYGYDELGRRSSRTAGGVTTKFLYDSADVVLDIGGDGSRVDYLNGLGIDKKLRQVSTGVGLYFLQDHLGSTTALTNATGGVIELKQYEAFGESMSSGLTRYLYTGREHDVAAMLIYYRARWFDSRQGRFMSEDPIGFNGGLNVYTYVDNNPLSYVDKYGLFSSVDRVLVQHFYFGQGRYKDISAWCNDYLADEAVQGLMRTVKNDVRTQLGSRIASGQPSKIRLHGQRTLYITTVFSFGVGIFHFYSVECDMSGDGCCANADCIIRFSAEDVFQDPLDLHQRLGIPIPYSEVGGRPFGFGLRCRDRFSVKICNK